MHTPIPFDVADAVFDEETHCLLLGGLVPYGTQIVPGMKLSVPVDPDSALELAIARVEVVGARRGSVGIAVWVAARSGAEASLLRALGIGRERLLVWGGAEHVDVDRHFVFGDAYAEVTISTRLLPRIDQTH
jgi:hypothetical protein